MLKFEELEINDDDFSAKRAKVPGGWLVLIYNSSDETKAYAPSLSFYPDPYHTWDGASLP